MITELELPLQPSLANYQVSTTISGQVYVFKLRWNSREGAWYMHVLEEDLTPIIYGVKIVLGAFLGRRVNHPLFLRGVLVAQDLSGQNLDPGFDDLGARVIVKYIPALDLIRRLVQVSR